MLFFPDKFMLRQRHGRLSEQRHIAGGFTLVEMLVTVALMVVLMLSVTQIFSIASRTMSGGQAISAALRDAQAAQAVLSHDFGSTAADGPCLVIRSTRAYAFRNSADAGADSDQNPATYDSDNDGTEDVTVPTLTYNFRNHRLDYLMFFARDRFSRQTGGANPLNPVTDPLVAEQTSNEAAIYLHHLTMSNNSGGYMDPGAGNADTNPDNYYASQWTLGRVAMLLAKPDPTTGRINDVAGTSQSYYARSSGLTPLDYTTVEGARLDLAGTTITDYARVLQQKLGIATTWATGTAYAVGDKVLVGSTVYAASVAHVADSTNQPPNGSYWAVSSAASVWTSGATYAAGDQVVVGGTVYTALIGNTAAAANKPPDAATWTRSATPINWYKPLMCDRRFRASATVSRPITAASASQGVPLFLPACTQFIVEFAGDYVTQDNDPASPTFGQVTAAVPDGRIDTVYNASLPAAQRNTGQIRWYGLPRDTTGDGLIRARDGDVVPVCDITRQAMPFEHFWPVTGTVAPAQTADNANTHTPIMSTDSDYLSFPPANAGYDVAWGPGDTDRPKLVRVTVVIDRPEAAGNLLDGQTFEYVFKIGL